MLLKYIFLFVVFCSTSVLAQMPNLKGNKGNFPTDPGAVKESLKVEAPAIIEDEGNLLIDYSDIKYSKTRGGVDQCRIYFNLKNDTEYMLRRMQVRFVWPSWQKVVVFSSYNPGATSGVVFKITGDSCSRLEETAKISLVSCDLAGKSISECGKLIKLNKL